MNTDQRRGSEIPSATLASLSEGQWVRVQGVRGEIEMRRRLLEMGLCPGATVQFVRQAPLGDPCEFRVRGYWLSLRREQARLVSVVPESRA